MQNVLIGALILAIVLPVGIFYLGERKANRFKKILGLNIVSFFGILLFATVFIFSGTVSADVNEAAAAAGGITNAGLAFIGAALSTGLGSIGAGIATGSAASAALGALSEKDSIMGKALIFVALAEGIAIYGLVIAVMILGRIPQMVG